MQPTAPTLSAASDIHRSDVRPRWSHEQESRTTSWPLPPSATGVAHKHIPAYSPTLSKDLDTPLTPSQQTHEAVCDVCFHPDPILTTTSCGHLFHSRCVHIWPMTHCVCCGEESPMIRVLPLDTSTSIPTRGGKWSSAEEHFIKVILKEFDRNALPLANGTPVRLAVSRLLNCSTMRLSKKFQKNALGKRTFRVGRPTDGLPAISFERQDHVERQIHFSRAEAVFHHELVQQYIRDNNTHEGARVDTNHLRSAVKQFWITNFLSLAMTVEQPVDGLDVSSSRKRKMAMQLLRKGELTVLLSGDFEERGAELIKVNRRREPDPIEMERTSKRTKFDRSSNEVTVCSSSDGHIPGAEESFQLVHDTPEPFPYHRHMTAHSYLATQEPVYMHSTYVSGFDSYNDMRPKDRVKSEALLSMQTESYDSPQSSAYPMSSSNGISSRFSHLPIPDPLAMSGILQLHMMQSAPVPQASGWEELIGSFPVQTGIGSDSNGTIYASQSM